jgi:hypothetical protein
MAEPGRKVVAVRLMDTILHHLTEMRVRVRTRVRCEWNENAMRVRWEWDETDMGARWMRMILEWEREWHASEKRVRWEWEREWDESDMQVRATFWTGLKQVKLCRILKKWSRLKDSSRRFWFWHSRRNLKNKCLTIFEHVCWRILIMCLHTFLLVC